MSRALDDAWVKTQLDANPPGRYKLLVTELFAFLGYRNDICIAMAACYNYGFRRGRNFERKERRSKDT